MALTRFGQHAVGAAEHGVLLVQRGRDAAQARGHQRRKGRIAAEADDGGRLAPGRISACAAMHAARQRHAVLRASATGDLRRQRRRRNLIDLRAPESRCRSGRRACR